MAAKPATIIGVDVGGTFTDLFFLDENSGVCEIGKVPTTLDNQANGIIEGIVQRRPELSTITTVIHGTTTATNALLERKGAVTGLITTAGFRDVLEMRRRDRPRTWGLTGQYEPVIPRNFRLEVKERTLANGAIRHPLDPTEVTAVAAKLVTMGAKALCVCFINAYANATNEQRAVAAIRQTFPNLYVQASSEILPEIREFERTSMTALNAYLQPVMAQYFRRLEQSLAARQFSGQILIVQSNGGVMTVDTASHLPIRTALSGPAAGVIAAKHIAQAAGFPNIITCDMGGTSFDVSLIAGGAHAVSAQTAIDFGLVIRTPMIDIHTIGAGGGSIASVNSGGILQIGPASAGSDPGPVCYGLGNQHPTVADANVVLGRINAAKPMGGKLAWLDAEAAKQAIHQHVGEALGLDAMAAAEAIIQVANAQMAGAIRLVSVEQGHDPRDFAAMPFGGGGGLHIAALIQDVGLSSAIIPRYPGITSALGCVVADMRHDTVQTLNTALADLEPVALAELMQRLARDGRALVGSSGVVFESIESLFELDMLYAGQHHAIAVPLPCRWREDGLTLTRDQVAEAFANAYRKAYGDVLSGVPVKILNLRISTIGLRPKFDLTLLAPQNPATSQCTPSEQRPVWIAGAWRVTPIYSRLELPLGTVINGPAILEQPDTTIYITPEMSGAVDRFGNLIVRRKSKP